ncbi:hypothetical protein CHLRE_03g164750v5 [Chlamydomonas reinhardtii]|uniref:Uncharacterized protein n=1 Tax=Chlamydomonas reinhardtii TaxID=3055 RepID=A0A2K3DWN0_CHLRE|nr:uncharacterized protein CHLRE_03g164750v5 [Chlamydomonas reinhardtii]PNW84934.1 hypothetical protein CHLRE_03g164750v5 [Chlamydomonas reinhardtii]
MASMLKGLQAVLPAMELLAQLQVAQFVYAASKASKSRQQDDFKLQLQTFYGNVLDEQCQLRCMLLNVQLPMALVTDSCILLTVY